MNPSENKAIATARVAYAKRKTAKDIAMIIAKLWSGETLLSTNLSGQITWGRFVRPVHCAKATDPQIANYFVADGLIHKLLTTNQIAWENGRAPGHTESGRLVLAA